MRPRGRVQISRGEGDQTHPTHPPLALCLASTEPCRRKSDKEVKSWGRTVTSPARSAIPNPVDRDPSGGRISGSLHTR